MLSRLTLGVVLLALTNAAPAVAQAPGAQSAEPAKPGTFRLNVKVPEASKWNVQRDAKAARTVYTCKPLACPDSLRVSVGVERSPTRNPNPQALEKLATVDLPKAARAASAAREIISDGAEKIETIVSETASFHGYPAVRNITKYSRAKSATFKGTTLIFAGPAMVRVEATSPNEALARETTEAFIAGMKFEEGPPAPKKPSGNTI
ncbi:MAG: hypothetical protein IT539_01010 [Bradyrhizobiaceae bacterium]|nr:hypothetical protein [Bradyrhizobiaceae bacterium]